VVLCPDGHIDVMHLMFDDGPLTAAHLTLNGSSQDSFVPSEAQATAASQSFAAGAPASAPMTVTAPETNTSSNLQEAVKSSEHQMILAAIQTTDSRMEAAAKLGISPRTLRYKLAKLKAESGNMAWAA
jgi:two-component system, response regulator FlrC